MMKILILLTNMFGFGLFKLYLEFILDLACTYYEYDTPFCLIFDYLYPSKISGTMLGKGEIELNFYYDEEKAKCYIYDNDYNEYEKLYDRYLYFRYYYPVPQNEIQFPTYETLIDAYIKNNNDKELPLYTVTFSYFDASKFTSMEKMFFHTPVGSVIFENIVNLNNVESMAYMFAECYHLTYIDFGNNFDTSSVVNMSGMFQSVTADLNLSSFNTSKVIDMEKMFSTFPYNDINRQSYYYFYNKYEYMIMFYITKKNINKIIFNQTFETSSVTNMKSMFENQKELKSLDLSSFNTSKVENFERMFYECQKLENLEIDFDFSSANYIKEMFYGCNSIQTLDLTKLYNPKVLSTESMFSKCLNLKDLNIQNFNALYVQNISNMFLNCSSLESLDLQNFNTINVKDMSYLFYGCENLKFLDISQFQTLNVTNMKYMFYNCQNLISLDISNFFALSTNNTSFMFYGCKNLLSLNFKNFKTSLITDMSYMFYECNNLISLDLTSINTIKVKNMEYMLYGCRNLLYLNISTFNTSSVLNFRYMFYNCEKLGELNLSNFNTSIAYTLESMFSNCNSLKFLDLSNFRTSKVYYMKKMFFNCTELSILNLSNFDYISLMNVEKMFAFCKKLKYLDLFNSSKKVNSYYSINMSELFYGCESLISLNLINFKFKNVNSMTKMFGYCSSLKIVNFSVLDNDITEIVNMEDMFYECNEIRSIDISRLKTNKVTSFSRIFYNCYKLEHLNLGQIYTSSLKNNGLEKIFYNCKSLKYIDLSEFETSSITSMDSLFYGCENLESVKLGNINTYNVRNMNQMFSGCKKLQMLDLSYFNTSNVISTYQMFSNCQSLQYIDIKNINISSINDMSEMFSNCYSLEYINLYSISDKINISINNIFSNVLNKFSYCIKNESFIGQIIQELGKKMAKNNCTDVFIKKNTIKINETSICPEEYPFKLLITQECVDHCNFLELYYNSCKINNSNQKTKYLVYNIIKFSIAERLIDDIINIKLNEENEDIFIKGENLVFQITSSENQKNKKYDNLSTIDLNNCENILKNIYNISQNQSLIILKVDSFFPEFINPTVEYDIFHPITKQILNLSICDSIFVLFPFPIAVEDSIIPYNNESIYNNSIYNLCGENCELVEYNTKKKRFICDCKKKDKIEKVKDIMCPENFPFKLISTQECVDYCNFIELFYNLCLINNNNPKALDIVYDIIKFSITEDLVDDLINDILNEENEDLLLEEYNTVFQITTPENQKNNEYNNLSTVLLGDCEDKLKEKYNIPKNLSLIILKVDSFFRDFNIPIVEYEVFNPITKEVLNLNLCESIEVLIPVSIPLDENNILLYNPKSEYFNDKCNPYTTENYTDITLNDRKNKYNKNNMGLCENNCEFSEYNNNTKKVSCNCKPKNTFKKIFDIDIDKDKLIHKFIDFNSTIRFDVIFCAKTLFNIAGILNNIGHYIQSSIILLHIINAILFIYKGFKSIISQIHNILKIKKIIKLLIII